jgi:hypothetical protein
VRIANLEESLLPLSRPLIENQYVVVVAITAFLLALVVSHGSLMVGLGVLALIAGLGWAERRMFHRRNAGSQNE